MTGSGRVAVVTDSTAYLPTETVERAGIGVVPLQVTMSPMHSPRTSG